MLFCGGSAAFLVTVCGADASGDVPNVVEM